MKINSVHIVSFGKIKNLKIDFSENLNILYGDNEAGKTHIADFIKMMFYGSGSRGTGVNNLRKKYKPWDNAKMGGSIDFTKDGTRYRLEREFKASNSADTITLHNLDLGTHQSLSGADNFGEQIFGISIGAFQQSVFIDNSVVFEADDKGELNLKLSNISNSAEEDISFEKIVKNISSAKETLISKNRKNGPIPEITAEIENLKLGKLKAIQIYADAEKKAEESRKALDKARHHIIVCLPYSMGGMVETLHNNAQVKNVDYTADGIEVETIVDDILYGRLREYIVMEL